MLSHARKLVLAALLATAGFCLAPLAQANAATAGVSTASLSTAAATLTNGKPVHGSVTGPAGVTYKFTAVAGHHVTLALTGPHTSPSGARLQLNVYDASGAQDASTDVFSTGPSDINFTPTADEAGPTKVVISPWDTGATGKFTLTYATDVTGTLTAEVAKTGATKFEGQDAVYTFKAVTGHHVTVALTKPHTSPSGERLQLNVYDSSGAQDASTDVFNSSPGDLNFTPTSAEAGTTYVVISPWDGDATGSFTLTYAGDVTGTLTAGVAKKGATKFEGQDAVYTFKAVKGHHVTVALTRPLTAPPGERLQLNVYDSSGAQDASTDVFNSSPGDLNFTPTADEAGTTYVVISPWDGDATGSFTLTYAGDIGGKLTSGKARKGTLKYEGQNADYTFTAVRGKRVTISISRPHTAPGGARLQLNVYDSSGAQDTSTDVFSTSGTSVTFTPTAAESGRTTIVISPWDADATGSFTITYKVR
jgi:hypothetical protein